MMLCTYIALVEFGELLNMIQCSVTCTHVQYFGSRVDCLGNMYLIPHCKVGY